MESILVFALICGALGVLYALVTASWVTKQDAGSQRMQDISNAVKEGAYAFLAREYKTVAIVAVPLFILIALVPALGLWTAIGFVIGTAGSAFAGFVGMFVTVRANVRTTQAATKGIQSADDVPAADSSRRYAMAKAASLGAELMNAVTAVGAP